MPHPMTRRPPAARPRARRPAGPRQRRRDRPHRRRVRRHRRRRRSRIRESVRVEGAARRDGRNVSPAGRARSALADVIRGGARGAASGSSPPCRAAARRCRSSTSRGRRRSSSAARARASPTAADRRPHEIVTIPMRAPVESLNVAVAAALILYEASRQRPERALMDLFADEPPRQRLRPIAAGPARRAHAAAHARRVRRPGGAARARTAAARRDRARSAAVDHPVGPARHRQDDARAASSPRATRAHFIAFSAVLSGIKEIREVMAEAEAGAPPLGPPDDPVHRRDPPLQQAQQDAFLPRVESGDIVLIGATTENPSFEVNSALLSRSKVYVLKPLDAGGDRRRSCAARSRIPSAASASSAADGDRRGARGDRPICERRRARRAQHARARRRIAPAGARSTPRSSRTSRRAARCSTTRRGEEHYNLISALHKSMRNSDPDASVYWLARMLEVGRGSALRRAAAGALRVGRRRQRRSAGARHCGRGQGRRALHRACRRATRRWRRRRSIWRRRRRATPSIARTATPRKRRRQEVAEPVPLHLRNAPTRLMKAAGLREGLPVRPQRGRGRARTWTACRRRTTDGGSTRRPTAASSRKSGGAADWQSGGRSLRDRPQSSDDLLRRRGRTGRESAAALCGTSPRAAAG